MLLSRCVLVVSLWAFGSRALAQEDPELGDTGAPATREPAPDTWGVAGEDSASGSAKRSWEQPSSPEWERGKQSEDDEDDHEEVVGSLSFGLLGLSELPVGVGDPVNAPFGARTVDEILTAPLLGSRYWMGERVGLELGVGFMFRRGSIEQTGGVSAKSKARAFALHGGLPIALFWGPHYNVLAIPYLGLGFTKATDTRGTAGNADDVFGDGFLFEVGLRMGVEVQLGAIGLPGFALQLTGGLRLRSEKRDANIPVLDNSGTVASTFDVKRSETVFATSEGSSLGSSIAGTLAALYYF